MFCNALSQTAVNSTLSRFSIFLSVFRIRHLVLSHAQRRLSMATTIVLAFLIGALPLTTWQITDIKKPADHSAGFLEDGGEGGIRTLDTLPYTHFPGVLLQPLGHLTILLCFLITGVTFTTSLVLPVCYCPRRAGRIVGKPMPACNLFFSPPNCLHNITPPRRCPVVTGDDSGGFWHNSHPVFSGKLGR